MNKKNQRFGLAAAVLAMSLVACGSTQGTSSALAGAPGTGIATDEGQLTNGVSAAHLTEFDQDVSKAAAIDEALQQAIALDQKNEQQRLSQQGANARPSVSSPGGTSATDGPALVP